MRSATVVEEAKCLLDLFEEMVPDHESNRLVWKFCDEKHRWPKAQGLHSTLRDRNSSAVKRNDDLRTAQYHFEEAIAKTLFNLTRPDAAFDPDSPYWVIKNALILAGKLNVPAEHVVAIVR